MILKMVFRLMLVVMIAVPVYLFGFREERDSYPAAQVSFGQVPRVGGTITMNGLIVSGTLERVKAELDRHPGEVQGLRVRSEEGTESAAGRLAQLVNRAGLMVRVEAGAVCGGACVLFLADVEPKLRMIDGRAWMLVRGRSELAAGEEKPDDAVYMATAVGQISSVWLAFLRHCKSEPLERTAGLAMTWGEVQGLATPEPSLNCEKIAFRDHDWLFGLKGPSVKPGGVQPAPVATDGGPRWAGGVRWGLGDAP